MYTFLDLKVKMYNYTKKKPFGTWQFGKIGVLVNFIIQKMKSKHLICFSLVTGFFEGTGENTLHIFRALLSISVFRPNVLETYEIASNCTQSYA